MNIVRIILDTAYLTLVVVAFFVPWRVQLYVAALVIAAIGLTLGVLATGGGFVWTLVWIFNTTATAYVTHRAYLTDARARKRGRSDSER
jgi:hypothetical protein